MPPYLVFSLAVAFAIFSQSHALLRQGAETEIMNSNRANERWIRTLPLSRDVGASPIKRNTRIAEKIRDLQGTYDSKRKSGMKKKTKKSGKAMSKETKSKGGKGKGGSDSDGSDGDNSSDGKGGNDSDDSESGTDSDHSNGGNDSDDSNGGNDSDNSEGTDSPEGSAFDISDCDSYSNEWLAELASFCGDNLDDLSACECPSARELLQDGTLVCASQFELGMSPPACPNGCPVCEFCMILEGCEDIYGP